MSRAQDLARLAGELQARIEALPDHVDPSWLTPPGPAGSAAGASAAVPREIRGAVSQGWFLRLGDPLPPLDLLEDSGARLALMDRSSLLARLCALALMGRPGVLRCCVQRNARLALQQSLGPAFAVLRARDGGPAVPPEVAGWPPIAWSWVGYRELARAGTWPDRGLRRMVRLALPASRADAPRPRMVPRASTAARDRLRALETLFAGDSPC